MDLSKKEALEEQIQEQLRFKKVQDKIFDILEQNNLSCNDVDILFRNLKTKVWFKAKLQPQDIKLTVPEGRVQAQPVDITITINSPESLEKLEKNLLSDLQKQGIDLC